MSFNVALLGGGMVSRVHLETLASHPLVESISLCDSNPLVLDELANAYSLKRISQDYHKLFDDPSINLVDICLPHHLHYPVALEAFEAGKHVILEKPISNSLVEADGMINAAKEAGLRFYVALNERYIPVHERVKQLLEAGLIGETLMASILIAGSELPRMQQPAHWKGSIGLAGGGVLADSGTHAIDLALYWFGLPESISCSLGRFVVRPVNKADDTASLILTYPDKIVTINLTYAADGQPWSEHRHIWGTDGSISVQIERDNPIQVWEHKKLIYQEVDHDAENWWADSVSLGLQHALNCFANDSPFPVHPEDARNILKVIRAAYKSAELKCQLDIEEIEGFSLAGY